jgi:Tol biopolymer transport system component
MRLRIRPFQLGGLLLAACLLLSAAPLDAQYFGRNNPQFRTFDFQVLQTEHFDIYYYPEAEEGVRDAARMAERWYTRLSQILGHEFELRQPLILYASHADFQQTNILGSPVGEGTGGVTESAKQRVIMPLAHTYSQTDHVLGHEIVHAFQYDMSGLGRSAGSIDAGGRALAGAPLWFVEGMAEYLTLGPVDAHTAMWLRDAAITGQLPTLRQLGTDPRIFPYRYGHALWAYIAGRWGDAVIGQILQQLGDGVTYAQAMQRVLTVSLDDLSAEWQAAVRRTYLPLLTEWEEPSQAARALVTRTQRGGRINIGPALSPDGTRLAFLSERGMLAVELWLADAQSGEVVRRLVRGAAFDTHFGSLNFIASAGSFSPDGQQLAFSALRRGRNVIALVDVDRARIVRQFTVPDVPEITNPDWSPDGQRIAFSGTQGGMTNLYVLDVRTGETQQLTTGRNADLMPAFSPDGRTIAFVTDRGPGTDLDLLHFEGYRIALLDVDTREISLLPGTEVARNFNPVWTPDGQSLYVLSDREGIANIYRFEVATGAIAQVTRIFQGISGFTELSPALAGARTADRLVFSVFDRGGYNLYSLDDATRLAGTPVAPAQWAAPQPGAGPLAAPLPAVLPPVPRPAEPAFLRVAGYLADPLAGLPSPEAAAAWEPQPYRPRLSLDYLGQPQVGFTTGGAVGRGGLYGGVAGVFSDMLAHHTVFGVVQAQGQFDEVGFSTAWLYRPWRWDLGVGLQRVPYISVGRRRGFDPQTNLFRDQVLSFRTFDWQVQGMAQLPISRSQRVEFGLGPRRLVRDIQIQEVVYDPVFDPGGQLTGVTNPRFQQETQSIDAINLFESSAALVFDNSIFGWTSPFAGRRYRFEVSPTFGTYQFVTGLADYRHYLWFRPLTLAGRGMHFGRYAIGEEAAQAIGPLFLGYPSLLRGYNYGDLTQRCVEAPPQTEPEQEAATPCQVLDQLFGSSIAVANLELRFPLIQALVIGPGIGLPPIEGFAFYDAGLAWGEGTTPGLTPGLAPEQVSREWLTSAGIGGRVNLLGYAVLEVGYVRPFTGDRGWHWHFAIQPGF